MTTRIATVAERFTASGGSSRLALQSPRIDDAVAILSAGAKLEQEDMEDVSRADAERLVRSVGNLPLAIDQAASYMRENRSSAQEVLDIYQSDEVTGVSQKNRKYLGLTIGLQVLQILSWENNLSLHEEKSVVAIFTPALNKIQQTAPDAVTLLRVLCFCDPEGIPVSIFTQGCNALYQAIQDRSSKERAFDGLKSIKGSRYSLRRVYSVLPQRNRNDTVRAPDSGKLEAVRDLFQSPLRLSKAIQEVQRLSLAAQAFEGSDRIIRIHDLVHVLLRSKLLTDTERGQWLRAAIRVICVAFGEIGNRRSPQNWSRCGRFISHIESLKSFAKQYGIEDHNILDASIWAAVYLNACGLYEKAAALNERTLNQQKRILGKRHPFTLTSMNNLAAVFYSQGKYKEAEGIYRQTLALNKSVLGKKHPNTLTNMNNLANILRSQGKYEEAEGIHRQTLALSESVLGKEHPDTLTSIAGLASTYWNQDRWKETEGLEVRVMETRKSILSAEHPDTLASMYNFASTLKSQSRNEEAIALMKQCLELENQILGPEHPDTKTSLEALRKWESREDTA